MPVSPAQRRYNRHALLLAALYALLLVAALTLFRRQEPEGALAILVAVLPALPIVGMFAAIGRYLLTEQDEYLRVVMVRRILVASGFALSVATVWGFLESFGVAPHVAAYYIAVVWFAGLGLGACVNRVLEARA